MTKKKILFLGGLLLLALSLTGSILCGFRYQKPKQQVFAQGESFVYHGIQYTLKNIRMSSFRDAMKEHGMTTADLVVGEEYMKWADQKKVFIGEIEIMAVDEIYEYDCIH